MKQVLLMAVLYILPHALCSQTIAKIFIVRHAERTPGDDLTQAGLKRAQVLMRVLGGSGITRIHSTNTVRTRKTARPLADSLNLTTVIYSSNAALVNTIKSTGASQRHLVVGHSDTVIEFITTCGCTPPTGLAPGIPGTQFDNLFLVLLKKNTVGQVISWSCEVMRMRYGAVTN